MDVRIPTWLKTLAIVGAVSLGLIAVVILAGKAHIFGLGDATKAARFGAAEVVVGAFVTLGLFAVFVYFGFHNGSGSAIYKPILAIVISLYCYLALVAPPSMDLLLNGRRTKPFEWFSEPEVVIFRSALFFGLIASLAWLLGVLLIRSGMDRYKVIGAMVGGVLLIGAAIYILTVVY